MTGSLFPALNLQMPAGRIDVHGHLLPGVDDGCKTPSEAVQCAWALVKAGYTHAFCTPHVWPSLPHNRPENIAARVADLQTHFAAMGVPLKLLPGGELNLHSMWPSLKSLAREEIPTYGLAGTHVLFDFWGEDMTECRLRLDPALDVLQSLKLTPILAHPERIAACRDSGALRDFQSRGVRLQLNSWCLTSPKDSPTYRFAERLLKEGQYFLIGTDLHDPGGMSSRTRGIQVAESLVGQDEVAKLTETNPRSLVPDRFTA